MSSKFVPVLAVPAAPGFSLPIPIQLNPPVPFGTRSTTPAVEQQFGFGTPEGRAWSLLLLRAAYLDDFQYTVTAAGFRDGLVNVERFQGAAFGEYRISLLEYASTILCVFHGVRNRASVTQVAIDMLTPRLTGSDSQFLLTGGVVGQAVLDVLDGGRWSTKPRASVAHSFGGVIASWLMAQIPDTHPFLGMMTFGTPKIGQANAPAAFNHDTTYCYGAVDDPFIGLPPSYIRLPEIAPLVAIWPLPAAAAAAVKRRLDAVWATFRSITSTPQGIGDQGQLTEMSDADNGRAWYARTNIGISDLLFQSNDNRFDGHKAATYYNRCRNSFPQWQTLNQAAGPGGRNADLLALAITAAEGLE